MVAVLVVLLVVDQVADVLHPRSRFEETGGRRGQLEEPSKLLEDLPGEAGDLACRVRGPCGTLREAIDLPSRLRELAASPPCNRSIIASITPSRTPQVCTCSVLRGSGA